MDGEYQQIVAYIRSVFGIEPLESEIDDILKLSDAILSKSRLTFSPKYPLVSGWWWVREFKVDHIVQVRVKEVQGKVRLCAWLGHGWKDVRYMTWMLWAGPIPLPQIEEKKKD